MRERKAVRFETEKSAVQLLRESTSRKERYLKDELSVNKLAWRPTKELVENSALYRCQNGENDSGNNGDRCWHQSQGRLQGRRTRN